MISSYTCGCEVLQRGTSSLEFVLNMSPIRLFDRGKPTHEFTFPFLMSSYVVYISNLLANNPQTLLPPHLFSTKCNTVIICGTSRRSLDRNLLEVYTRFLMYEVFNTSH